MKAFKTIFLFLLLLLVSEKSFAQSLTVNMPTLACLNQTVHLAADTMGVSVWSISVTPPETTLSLDSKNSQVLITFTSCGTHTVFGQAYDNFSAPIPGSSFSQTINVLCVNAPTITTTYPYASVCTGFTSTLTAFGANTYTWLPSGSTQQSISVGPGTYTVIGSNSSGCENQDTVFIGIAPSLTLTTSQSSQTTCIMSNFPKFSKPIQLSATGAGNYVWFPYNPTYPQNVPQITVRPSSNTCYTVIGTTPNCKDSAVVCVTVIPQFAITVAPPNPTICLSESVVLSITSVGVPAVGPSSAYTYSWTEALNAPPISISSYYTQTVSVYPQNTTTYTAEVRDARGCVSLAKFVTVTVDGVCTGLDEMKGADNFILFPNPANDKLFIQATTDSPISFKIINLIGELVFEQQNVSSVSVYEIILNNFKSGVYSCVLETEGGTFQPKLFIKL